MRKTTIWGYSTVEPRTDRNTLISRKEGMIYEVAENRRVASVVNAFFWVLLLVVLIVVFPHLGLVNPSDWRDPAKGLAAWAASPGVFSTLDIGNVIASIASLLVILALRERMKVNAPTLMTIALIGVSIFSALWLAAGLSQWEARPSVVSANDVSAYIVANSVFLSLSAAAAHALGWALLLTGWAAFKTTNLPRTLTFLGMLAGLAFLFEFVVSLLGFVGAAFFAVFSVWAGIVLLRSKN